MGTVSSSLHGDGGGPYEEVARNRHLANEGTGQFLYGATGSALRVSQSGEGTNAGPEGDHSLGSWLWQSGLSKGRGSPKKAPNIVGRGGAGQGRAGVRGQLALEEIKLISY